MYKKIKCVLGIMLIFAVLVMPAFAATGEENVKVKDVNGSEKTDSVKKSDNKYDDITDLFESPSQEDSEDAVDELFPSMGQGVAAVKQIDPVWNPARFTTWFIIGICLIVGVITFSGHYLKANLGALGDKVKWVVGGQKGMFISGLLLLVFIVYLSIIKFIANF